MWYDEKSLYPNANTAPPQPAALLSLPIVLVWNYCSHDAWWHAVIWSKNRMLCKNLLECKISIKYALLNVMKIVFWFINFSCHFMEYFLTFLNNKCSFILGHVVCLLWWASRLTVFWWRLFLCFRWLFALFFFCWN